VQSTNTEQKHVNAASKLQHHRNIRESMHLADALSQAYINNLPLPDEKAIKNVNFLENIRRKDRSSCCCYT
jgi:hypothetical protein